MQGFHFLKRRQRDKQLLFKVPTKLTIIDKSQLTIKLQMKPFYTKTPSIVKENSSITLGKMKTLCIFQFICHPKDESLNFDNYIRNQLQSHFTVMYNVCLHEIPY